MTTPLKPAPDCVGLPLSAIMPAYSGFSRSATVAGKATRPTSQPIDMKPV